MAGRKRTPSALAKLRGNPGKRKRAVEPQFDPTCPSPPKHLDKTAIEEWYRITTLMSNANMMTPAYRAILSNYCQTWGELVELSNELPNESRYLETRDKGYRYKNPIFSDVAKLRKELKGYSAELGITPVTLSKAHIVGSGNTTRTPEQTLAERLFKIPVKIKK